jgi:hypothetical protein
VAGDEQEGVEVMTPRSSVYPACILAIVFAAAATDAPAQGRRGPGAPSSQASAVLPSDPLTGPVVTNAPYSGDAVTTVVQTLTDGTRIEQKAEAKFFRDSAGRVRSEQTILGLAWLNGSAQTRTAVTIFPVPSEMFAYTLDPGARTARRVPRGTGAFGLRLNGSFLAALDVLVGANALNRGRASAGAGQLEDLGTRQIEGVRTTGRKMTSTIPTGQIGNDRPIEITEERWESPELRVLIYSRFSDPRTGIVEFKLTNINRSEPPADLFTVPSDYTVIEPGAGGRGGRVGAPGERGRQ